MKNDLRRSWHLFLIITLAALPAFASQPSVRTFTELAMVSPQSQAGTTADVRVNVVAANGDHLSGTATLMDGERTVAGAAVKDGVAEFFVTLAGGTHQLKAVYTGDDEHLSSASSELEFHGEQSGSPSYVLSVNPASLSLTAGEAGDVQVTLTPSNNQSTTGPTFFTLSCSGLPADSSCYYTPETIQIPAGSNNAVTSSFTLQTQAQSGALHNPFRTGSGIALAIILPGIFALGFLGRGRSRFTRLMMLGFVVLAASVSLTGCAPRYNYFNHGPPRNPATPPGTYTIQITAQTNNGVTATNATTTLALTVQ